MGESKGLSEGTGRGPGHGRDIDQEHCKKTKNNVRKNEDSTTNNVAFTDTRHASTQEDRE